MSPTLIIKGLSKNIIARDNSEELAEERKTECFNSGVNCHKINLPFIIGFLILPSLI
jgi:hypothetical protein